MEVEKWEPPQWLSDERPYVVEEVETTPYLPPRPICYHCCATPDGKCTQLICPNGHLELFRVALEAQHNPNVHCLLVGMPQKPGELNRAELRHWRDLARARIRDEKPIHLLAEGRTRYACGNEPLCRSHRKTVDEQTVEYISHMVENVYQIDEFIRLNFPNLNERAQGILHAWATHESATKGKPITQVEVGKRFGIKRRRVIDILNMAKNTNLAAFNKLQDARKHRIQIIRTYRVPHH